MRRRIIGFGDHGLDVLLLQYMLNRILPVQVELPDVFPGIKELLKRASPESWGYYWAPGAMRKHDELTRKRHTTHHARLHVVPTMPGRWMLQLDGAFGPKTEGAVVEYQRRVGVPDDGIVGPETWERLCPFWVVVIWFKVVGNTGAAAAGGSGTVTGTVVRPPLIGNPYKPGTTKLDNVEFQSGSTWNLGSHFNKSELSSFSVVQFTWKTDTEPDEIIPGHWEHTGGFEKNIPYGKAAGSNLQIFYQLTRAELVSFGEDYKLTLVAPFVQGQVQAPLDAGTRDDPNRNQIGVALGNTISLEITPGHGPVTIKFFAQGTVGATVDDKGKVEGSFGGLLGASAQINTDFVDKFLNPKGAAPPPKKGTLNVDPRQISIKRGQEGVLSVTLNRPPERTEYADVNTSITPTAKIRIPTRSIPTYGPAELYLQTEADSPTGTYPLSVSAYYQGTGITVWCDYEVQVTITE